VTIPGLAVITRLGVAALAGTRVPVALERVRGNAAVATGVIVVMLVLRSPHMLEPDLHNYRPLRGAGGPC
jgi:hypothetical protein